MKFGRNKTQHVFETGWYVPFDEDPRDAAETIEMDRLLGVPGYEKFIAGLLEAMPPTDGDAANGPNGNKDYDAGETPSP